MQKILVADHDGITGKKRGEYLRQSGFDVKVTSSGYLTKKTIMEWRPDFIIIDLLFQGFYAQEALSFLKEKNMFGPKGTKVIVTSQHNSPENVKACIHAGAHDFMVKPFSPLDLLNRLLLIAQSISPPQLKIVSKDDPKLPHYFKMIDLLSKNLSLLKPKDQIRWDIVRMIALTVKSVRTSLIEIENRAKNFTVISSSDDIAVNSLKLNPEKYPEIEYVQRTEKPLFIKSIKNDRTLSIISKQIQSIQFDSMVVIPVFLGPDIVAALSIRMPEECSQPSPWDIKIAEIGANLLSSTWKFKEVQTRKKAS